MKPTDLTALGAIALGGRIALLGVERIVVKRLGGDPPATAGSRGSAPAFLFFLIATVFLAPLLAFHPLPAPGRWLLVVAANSLVYAGAFVLYVAALSAGEASFVSPFYNFNVLFLLLLAAVFLGESIAAAKLAGIALLVVGSWMLARASGLARPFGRTRRSAPGRAGDPAPGPAAAAANRRAAALMIGCSLLMAVGRTVDTSQVRSIGSVAYAFAIYAGVTLWLGVFAIASGHAAQAARLARERPWTAVAAGAINAFSYLLLLVALGSMEVSVAEPASMLSLLVTLVLAGLVFRERIVGRIVPTLLMIAGAWMLLS